MLISNNVQNAPYDDSTWFLYDFPQPGIGGARVRSRWGAVRTITMGRDQVKRNQAVRGRGRGSGAGGGGGAGGKSNNRRHQPQGVQVVYASQILQRRMSTQALADA